VRTPAIWRETRAVLHVRREETRAVRTGLVGCAVLQVARPDATAPARRSRGLADRSDSVSRTRQLDFLPPLRPAAAFCALLPALPLPLPRRLWLLPLLLPPWLEESGEFAIAVDHRF
jgi:hypothetical protein